VHAEVEHLQFSEWDKKIPNMPVQWACFCIFYPFGLHRGKAKVLAKAA